MGLLRGEAEEGEHHDAAADGAGDPRRLHDRHPSNEEGHADGNAPHRDAQGVQQGLAGGIPRVGDDQRRAGEGDEGDEPSGGAA